jgi:hypothetical protein
MVRLYDNQSKVNGVAAYRNNALQGERAVTLCCRSEARRWWATSATRPVMQIQERGYGPVLDEKQTRRDRLSSMAVMLDEGDFHGDEGGIGGRCCARAARALSTLSTIGWMTACQVFPSCPPSYFDHALSAVAYASSCRRRNKNRGASAPGVFDLCGRL